MKNSRKNKLGLLERTIIELKNKGISSIDEIRAYLIDTYQLTVTKALLRKRMDGLSY